MIQNVVNPSFLGSLRAILKLNGWKYYKIQKKRGMNLAIGYLVNYRFFCLFVCLFVFFILFHQMNYAQEWGKIHGYNSVKAVLTIK